MPGVRVPLGAKTVTAEDLASNDIKGIVEANSMFGPCIFMEDADHAMMVRAMKLVDPSYVEPEPKLPPLPTDVS